MGLGGGAGSYGEILQTRNVGVGEGSNGGFKGSGRGDTSKTHGGGVFYISIFLYFYISIFLYITGIVSQQSCIFGEDIVLFLRNPFHFDRIINYSPFHRNCKYVCKT